MQLNLTENIYNFLKYMELIETCSPLTIKSYKKDLEQAFSSSNKLRMPARKGAPGNIHHSERLVDESQLLGLAREALTSWGPLSPASRNRKASVLKSFFNYLFREKLIQKPLADLIYTTKVPKKIPNYISVDEALAVLRISFDRDRLLFLLLYGGGLRVSEACQLKWKNVDLNQKLLRILGKGRKERLVALPDMAIEELKAELKKVRRKKLESESDSPYIWGAQELNQRTAYSMIRNLGIKSQLIRPLHPHALRHSFATHLLSSGANLRTLQELLGHQSLTATEKYTHLGVDQLARTMETNHPLGQRSSTMKSPKTKVKTENKN